MTTISSLFSRLVLALTLATAAGAVMAVPTSYHVTLDTSAYAAIGTGYLDLSFGAIEMEAGAATAVVSNATGAITGTTDVIGVVDGDLTTTASFNNAAYGDLAQLVQFGGMFSFDVLFDFAATGYGSSFAISLLDSAFDSVTGSNFAAQITLTPGDGAAFVTFTPFATITENAAAVPEPGQWLLMLSGLLLMGAMVRRRNM